MVYLVRQCRTVLNAHGLLRGHLDPPLDDFGQEEAEALGREVAGFHPELILTSPLKRAVETAEAIGIHCGIRPHIENRLIDRDYGRWAGVSPDEVLAEWGSLDAAPEVELVRSVFDRATAVLESVVTNKRVVIVTHAAISSLLMASLETGRPQSSGAYSQPTGCYSVIRHLEDGWTILEIGIVPHK